MVVREARRSKKSSAPRSSKKAGKPSGSAAAPKKAATVVSGRFSAPLVRLGMSPSEVKRLCGQPECILFGSDDHVEWQFGTRGLDRVGAPTLYVTTLTFAAGRIVRITERMTEDLVAHQ